MVSKLALKIALEGIIAGIVPELIQFSSAARKRQTAPTPGNRLQAAKVPGETVLDLTLGMDAIDVPA